jgi:hypothetical protein
MVGIPSQIAYGGCPKVRHAMAEWRCYGRHLTTLHFNAYFIFAHMFNSAASLYVCRVFFFSFVFCEQYVCHACLVCFVQVCLFDQIWHTCGTA